MTSNLQLPTYWYQGRCLQTGEWLHLPRTLEAEAIARHLMQSLATDEQYSQEGKMYGVLLAETASGERQVLKAFSGLLNGCSHVVGWVPPIPGREQIILEETTTLAALDALKQELIALQQCPERQQYQVRSQHYEEQLQQLSQVHQQRQQERQQQRERLCETLTGATLAIALNHLDDESRRDGIERRRLKQQRNAALQPLKEVLEQQDTRIQEIRQQRKHLSRQLQTQMHTVYSLTNFAGQVRSLQDLMPQGLPTGTGDCCAPKLLHHAAIHRLKPLAMAEFWWGPPSIRGDKVSGEFYGACAERCQPLMGFLLSASSQTPIAPLSLPEPLTILYQDDWLLAVDKPAGLLSVPGRYGDRQDSVLSRLQCLFPDAFFTAVHRLDQDTSGVLLLAKRRESDRRLRQQFEQRQVHKIYEAVLAGSVSAEKGRIDLPLWSDLSDRPYQKVDWQHGKPSLTQFQVIQQAGSSTRVEFIPLTGRTHQLRVHAAHPAGLGVPIRGDRLYGNGEEGDRLYLHARELQVYHPRSGEALQLRAETPF